MTERVKAFAGRLWVYIGDGRVGPLGPGWWVEDHVLTEIGRLASSARWVEGGGVKGLTPSECRWLTRMCEGVREVEAYRLTAS